MHFKMQSFASSICVPTSKWATALIASALAARSFILVEKSQLVTAYDISDFSILSPTSTIL